VSDVARRRMTELIDGDAVEIRTIAHHERAIGLTRIVRNGPMLLDPPGITLIDRFPPGVA
jgi:hypothetical protein